MRLPLLKLPCDEVSEAMVTGGKRPGWWQHGIARSFSNLMQAETPWTAVAQTIPCDEVVGGRRGGIVALCMGSPTSHARDLRHGLRRSSFRAVDTAFFARPWLVMQAAQSQQAGLAFACGAGRPQG